MDSELQAQFDQFLITIWKTANYNCGFTIFVFAQRCGCEVKTYDENSFKTAREYLRDLGLTRIPTLKLRHMSVGMWLANAYPTFLDHVARTKDAHTITLGKLPFRVVKYIPPLRGLPHRGNIRTQFQSANLGVIKYAHDHRRRGSTNKLR